MRVPASLVPRPGSAACAPYRQRLLEAAGVEGSDLDDPMRMHVERCRACQEELTELLRTARILHRLGDMTRRVEPPPGDWAALRSRLVAERSAGGRRPRRSVRPLAEGLALAIAPTLVALLLAPQAGFVTGEIPTSTALVEPGTQASAVEATVRIVPWIRQRGTSAAAPTSGTPASGTPASGAQASGAQAGGRALSGAPPNRAPADRSPDGRPPGSGPIDVVRPDELSAEADVVDTPPGQDVRPAESATALQLPPGGGSSDRPVTADASPDPRGVMSPQQTLGPPGGPRLSRTID